MREPDPWEARCWHCGRILRVKVDGTTFHHKGPRGEWLCPGAGEPKPEEHTA